MYMKKYIPLISLLLVIISGQISEQALPVLVAVFTMSVVTLPQRMFWEVTKLEVKNPLVESFRMFYILITIPPALIGTAISPYNQPCKR
jgi:hypothetical protein